MLPSTQALLAYQHGRSWSMLSVDPSSCPQGMAIVVAFSTDPPHSNSACVYDHLDWLPCNRTSSTSAWRSPAALAPAPNG